MLQAASETFGEIVSENKLVAILSAIGAVAGFALAHFLPGGANGFCGAATGAMAGGILGMAIPGKGLSCKPFDPNEVPIVI